MSDSTEPYRLWVDVPAGDACQKIEEATGYRPGVINGGWMVRFCTERVARAYAAIFRECGASVIRIERLEQKWVNVE